MRPKYICSDSSFVLFFFEPPQLEQWMGGGFCFLWFFGLRRPNWNLWQLVEGFQGGGTELECQSRSAMFAWAGHHAWGSPNWKVRKVNFNFSQNLVDCLCIVKSIILFYQECCAFFGWVGQCNGACFRFSLVRFPNPYACSSHAGHASGSPGRDIHLAQLNCGRFRSVSAVNIYISYIVYCAKQYCERFGSI